MTTPIDIINEVLHVAADRTLRGDEVKVWIPDDEGPGLMKSYLSVDDCDRLADAFRELGNVLRTDPASPSRSPAPGEKR